MGKQARKRTANIISAVEQRRLRLEEEIRALEAQPDSPSRNKRLETKKKQLASVDKEKHNWLGLEDKEDLSAEHFVKNLQAVLRQRKAELATSIKGAIGTSILGADPIISSTWTGALMLRDMFRGSSTSDDLNIPTRSSTPTEPNTPAGSSDNNLVTSLLANIATTVENTYQLLDWVYTYRRARFREIMNIEDLKAATKASIALTENDTSSDDNKNLIDTGDNSLSSLTKLIQITKEGLFGSPKLLGPTGPIATRLDKLAVALLVQGQSISDLEPTEEETREAHMRNRKTDWASLPSRIDQMNKQTEPKNKGSNPLVAVAANVIPGIAGGIAGGTTAGLATNIGSKFLKMKWLKLAGLAGTFTIMAGMDAAKGWIYKHKEWGSSQTAAAVASGLTGTGEGWKSTFANMGKWGAAGALIGAPFAPPIGSIVGFLLGSAIGGILSYLGGQTVSNWIDSIGDFLFGKTKLKPNNTNIDPMNINDPEILNSPTQNKYPGYQGYQGLVTTYPSANGITIRKETITTPAFSPGGMGGAANISVTTGNGNSQRTINHFGGKLSASNPDSPIVDLTHMAPSWMN